MNKIQNDFQLKLIEDLTSVVERNFSVFSKISPENAMFFSITSVHTLIVLALIQSKVIDERGKLETNYTYDTTFDSIKTTDFLKKIISKNESN